MKSVKLNAVAAWRKIVSLFSKRIVIKLFIVYFLAISIPVAILGVLSFRISSSAIERDYIVFKESLNSQISSSIDENLSSLNKQSASIMQNIDDISSFLDFSPETIDDNYFKTRTKIVTYFLGIIQNNERLEGIGLVNINGDTMFYLDKNQISYNLVSVKHEKWFSDTVAAAGDPIVLKPHLNNFYESTVDRKKVITVSRLIKDYNNNNSVKGVLVFDQNVEQFGNLVAYTKTVPSETLLILGQEDSLVYSNDLQLDEAKKDEIVSQLHSLKQGSYKVSIANQKVLLSFNTSSDFGWKVVSLIPLSVISQKSAFLKNINLTLLLILVFIVFIISLAVSNIINLPLKKLIASFRKLQKGDFNTTVPVKGEDELAQIGITFNKMVINMKELIKQKYELNILKKQAELASLQSQINPHFLYNTLSSTKSIIDQKDFEKASIIVQSLSDIFRYSLNRGKFIVDFAEELDHIKKYLFIQETRFAGKYEIIYDIDQEVLHYQILRMTLQPIVENALYHGMELKRGKGNLKIIAKAFSDKIYIYIMDDGVGIAADELERMNRLLSLDPEVQMETSPEKVGIYNVNARLKFYYGNEYGIKVSSTVGAGTHIKISLPAQHLIKGESYIENINS